MAKGGLKGGTCKKLEAMADNYKKVKREILEKSKDGLRLVTLHWGFKGKKFDTQCFVSLLTDKVLYDGILSNLDILIEIKH